MSGAHCSERCASPWHLVQNAMRFGRRVSSFRSILSSGRYQLKMLVTTTILILV